MRRSLWRDFDWLLLIATVVAIGFGVAMIYSADPWANSACPGVLPCAGRQAVHALAGLVILLIVAAADYRFLRSLGWLAYVAAIGLLLAVLGVGAVSGGSQRWLDFGFLPVQPSEFAKLLLIIALAKYMADNDMRQLRHLAISLGLTIIPIGLIYQQPDLGTASGLLAVWLAMAFVAGMRVFHMGVLGLGAGIALPIALAKLEGYMQDRIALFLDPTRDPLGLGFSVTQALIAVGSGGWLGRGYASGTQSQLRFLRIRHTDFIFSVLAEELGFVGALILFALLAFLILRVVRVGHLARDDFGRLIAVGVATVILFQTFINIGVNINLVPPTGIPLPFISYGGSSLVTLLIALGLVQSIVMRRPRAFEF
ncbi:MAG: rod shape-determining protein RodA [Anaerolineae bacterium]